MNARPTTPGPLQAVEDGATPLPPREAEAVLAYVEVRPGLVVLVIPSWGSVEMTPASAVRLAHDLEGGSWEAEAQADETEEAVPPDPVRLQDARMDRP